MELIICTHMEMIICFHSHVQQIQVPAPENYIFSGIFGTSTNRAACFEQKLSHIRTRRRWSISQIDRFRSGVAPAQLWARVNKSGEVRQWLACRQLSRFVHPRSGNSVARGLFLGILSPTTRFVSSSVLLMTSVQLLNRCMYPLEMLFAVLIVLVLR